MLGRRAILANRYEIQLVLGEGGMGMVYKAHDRVLDETVALKVLRPDFARTTEADRRFRSEIKLARKVSHRNVCRIHEYGEDGELRFISMEYVDGINLKQAVRGRGGLPLEEAREVGIQIAKGLQAIHDVGVIHRDLKTANIMRDRHGIVRLMDFGIAKKWGEDVAEGLTGVGDILGTPEYMSPEQARGQKLDFRSDIYAVGVVLFEILTGDLPFRGENALDTLLLHVQQPPPLEGRVPPLLMPIVRKALAKDPKERYASARGLAADLRATLPGAGAGPPVPAVPSAVYSANLAETTPVPSLEMQYEIVVEETDEDSSGGLPALPSAAELAEATPAARPAPTPTLDLLKDLGEPADDATRQKVLELAAQLRSGEVSKRWKAALALWKIGPVAKDAAAALAEAIDDTATSVSDAAAQAYRRITGKPAPARQPSRPQAPHTAAIRLQEILKSPDPSQRWQAVLALGELGPAAGQATPALVEALDDLDDSVRWAAATSLGRIGVAARDAVPALAAALHDRSDTVIHKHAAAALGKMGPAARDAVPGLIGALHDKDSTVREEVLDALVRIGAGAVPALIEALKDEDEQVRFEAADALTRIGTQLQTSPKTSH